MIEMHAANVRWHEAKKLFKVCHQARTCPVGLGLQQLSALPVPDRRPTPSCEPPDGDTHRASQPARGGQIQSTAGTGPTDYIVHAAGNTRLMILKELFDETSDPRYAQVPCAFRPWNRESDVLLAGTSSGK